MSSFIVGQVFNKWHDDMYWYKFMVLEGKNWPNNPSCIHSTSHTNLTIT